MTNFRNKFKYTYKHIETKRINIFFSGAGEFREFIKNQNLLILTVEIALWVVNFQIGVRT